MRIRSINPHMMGQELMHAGMAIECISISDDCTQCIAGWALIKANDIARCDVFESLVLASAAH